jgi:hypothetical protein
MPFVQQRPNSPFQYTITEHLFPSTIGSSMRQTNTSRESMHPRRRFFWFVMRRCERFWANHHPCGISFNVPKHKSPTSPPSRHDMPQDSVRYQRMGVDANLTPEPVSPAAPYCHYHKFIITKAIGVVLPCGSSLEKQHTSATPTNQRRAL